MNTLIRRIAFASLAVTLVSGGAARAFTDSNADLKEAEPRSKLERVVVTAKAAPPVQTAWVPVSSKKLDGFKPVLPARPDGPQALAKAELPAAIKR